MLTVPRPATAVVGRDTSRVSAQIPAAARVVEAADSHPVAAVAVAEARSATNAAKSVTSPVTAHLPATVVVEEEEDMEVAAAEVVAASEVEVIVAAAAATAEVAVAV